MSIRRELAVVLLCASSLVAQTFVVDAANGPGANFTDVQAAVTAVPDGAILRVRAGSYGPVQVAGKGLTILCDANVLFSAVLQQVLQVRGLSTQQSFTLQGGRVAWSPDSVVVECANCAGPILLEGFVADGFSPRPGFTALGPQALVITDCQQVTAKGCTLFGSHAVRATRSDLVLEACTLRGSIGFFFQGTGTTPAGVALGAEDSSVRIADCTLTGGQSIDDIRHFPPVPGVALELHRCTVWIGGNSSLAGGTSISFAQPPVVAIAGDGVVHRDPLVVLQPQGGAPAVEALVQDDVRPWPSVTSVMGQPGAAIVATARGGVGTVVLLAISWPAAPQALNGIDGELWLDAQAAVLAAFGAPTATAPVIGSIAPPASPTLLGMRGVWQALSWEPSLGFQLSNASTYVHGR